MITERMFVKPLAQFLQQKALRNDTLSTGSKKYRETGRKCWGRHQVSVSYFIKVKSLPAELLIYISLRKKKHCQLSCDMPSYDFKFLKVLLILRKSLVDIIKHDLDNF